MKNAYIQTNSKDVKNLMVYRKCRGVKVENQAREATVVKDEKDAQKRGRGIQKRHDVSACSVFLCVDRSVHP